MGERVCPKVGEAQLGFVVPHRKRDDNSLLPKPTNRMRKFDVVRASKPQKSSLRDEKK